MRKLLPLFLCLCSMFLLVGCACSQKAYSEKRTLDYSIIIGSGGGFTGMYQGKYVDTSGVVYSWEGTSFNNSKRTSIKKLEQEQISQLNNYFEKNTPEKIAYNQSGNLTNFIVLKGKGKEISISWIYKFPKDDTPQEIMNLNNYITNTINK